MLVADVRTADSVLERRHATGVVVGLTGQWGLGKSTVLHHVYDRLSQEQFVIVALFNPWLFKGRDELLNAFFNSIRDAIGRSSEEDAVEILGALEGYWAAISKASKPIILAAALAPIVAVPLLIFKCLGDILFGWVKKRQGATPEEKRAILEKRIAGSKLAVVVLIDELDRVEPRDVKAVAQLVKAVGDIEGISYLVAYDSKRVIDALGYGADPERASRGAHYLEKIIQFPIPLRPLFEEDIRGLINHSLESSDLIVDLPPKGRKSRILNYIVEAAETPRDIKRLIGTFEALIAALRQDVCAYDVLAYSWLLIKHPSVREGIARKLDELVEDPSETSALARSMRRYSSKKAPEPEEILGPDAIAIKELLKLMFPVFEATPNEVGDAATLPDPLRISRRQNLVRTLYLGNPRNLISRQNVIDFWSLGDADQMFDVLRGYREQQLLPTFIDRVADFILDLPTDGDAKFWRAATRLLERSQDWIEGPDDRRGLIEDLASILFKMSLSGRPNRLRSKSILSDMIGRNELVLVPYILRRHLFRYGMTRHGSKETKDTLIWDPSETSVILESEIERYAHAVLSGLALRRLPTFDVAYAIGNVGRWTHELRESLTAQIDSQQAIGTLAAITVPPGYVSDRESFDEFLDVEKILDRARSLGPVKLWDADPWVKISVQRLIAVLEGKDPTFMDFEEPGEAEEGLSSDN